MVFLTKPHSYNQRHLKSGMCVFLLCILCSEHFKASIDISNKTISYKCSQNLDYETPKLFPLSEQRD